MRTRILATSLAALSLVASPVMAQTTPADRAAAPVAEESDLMGGSFLWIVIAIAVVVGAILLLDDDGDPVSP